MAYTPSTDFLALSRLTSGGARFERMPGTDYLLAAMARAGMFLVSVGQAAPTIDKESTVWIKPSFPNSWASEASIFIYNIITAEYEPATPALWAGIFSDGATSPLVQEVTEPGPVNIHVDSGIVKVNQLISAPITLIMPSSALKNGNVLVSDWKADSAAGNDITVQMSDTDKLPGNQTSWVLNTNAASLLFRPIPGGYVI